MLQQIAINNKANMQWPCAFTNWQWRNTVTNALWDGKGITKIIYHGQTFNDAAKRQAKAGTAMHNQLDLNSHRGAELGPEASALLKLEAQLFPNIAGKATEVFLAGNIGGHPCVAYADAIIETQDGLHIVDYKFTSKTIKWAKNSCGGWSLQLAGMAKLMHDMHGIMVKSLSVLGYSKVDQEAFIIGVQIDKLTGRLTELEAKAHEAFN